MELMRRNLTITVEIKSELIWVIYEGIYRVESSRLGLPFGRH